MKKLIPALCLLLVSAVMLGTSTFAWFSMNNKVTVTGMEVTTKVGNNLFIVGSTAGNTKSADTAFVSGINQSVTGVLQPVSTVDAVNFAYTYEAKVNGAIADGAQYIGVTDGKKVKSGETVMGDAYVDYVFEVKAMNASPTEANYITFTKLNLLYNNAAVAAEKAYRVAVFTQALNAGGTAYEAMGAASAIYSLDGAVNQTEGKAVKYTPAVAEPETPAVFEIDDVLAATKIDLPAPANKASYYKITVRMWLEGEDTTCTSNTFMPLTGKWTLDLALELKTAEEAGVAALTTTANATLGAATNVLTAALTVENENAKSYTWYKVNVAEAKQTKASTEAGANTYTVTEDGDYYCVIETNKGSQYKTPIVNVDVE